MNLAEEAGVLEFCEQQRKAMVDTFHRLGRYEVNGNSCSAVVFTTRAAPQPDGVHADPLHWQQGPKLDTVTPVEVTLPAFVRALLPPQQHTACFRYMVDGMWVEQKFKKGKGRLVGVLPTDPSQAS